MVRAHYLPVTNFFRLNRACEALWVAFDAESVGVFLVGSSLERRDYRDVDVRCMLRDEAFARMFPGCVPGQEWNHAQWSIVCVALATYLEQQSGLPVDFQFQQMSQANAEFGGRPRNAVGLDFRSRTSVQAGARGVRGYWKDVPCLYDNAAECPDIDCSHNVQPDGR